MRPDYTRVAVTIAQILTRLELTRPDPGPEDDHADDRVRESVDRRSGRELP